MKPLSSQKHGLYRPCRSTKRKIIIIIISKWRQAVCSNRPRSSSPRMWWPSEATAAPSTAPTCLTARASAWSRWTAWTCPRRPRSRPRPPLSRRCRRRDAASTAHFTRYTSESDFSVMNTSTSEYLFDYSFNFLFTPRLLSRWPRLILLIERPRVSAEVRNQRRMPRSSEPLTTSPQNF